MFSFPDAFWIFPRRNIEDILDSFARHPLMKFQRKKLERINLFWERQRYIANSRALHRFVYPDKFGAGDSEAKALIENLGMKFDAKIFDEWYDPELWHSSLEDSTA